MSDSPQHERKFVFPGHAVPAITNWLESRCVPDPRHPAGIVSSIYYDTRDLRHLREKLNSDFFKTKVRLRWYADAESGEPQGMAYLEIKRKVGRSRSKIRAETDLSAAYVSDLDLHAQEHRQIGRRLGELGFPAASLAPLFQITFRRRRFVDPFTGARLAIDQEIRVPRVNHQLAPRANPTALSKAVCEVKGLPDQVPEFIPLLISFGGRKESFSKYFHCYQHLMQTTF